MSKKMLFTAMIIEITMILLVIIIYNPFLKLKLIGSEIVNVSVGAEYEEKGVKATYFGEDLTDEVVIRSNVNVNKIGEYKVIYSLKKNGIVKKIIRTVFVKDITPPEITLNGEETINLCGRDYVDEGATAIDDVDGDLTSEIKISRQEDKIIYSVIDKSGNKSELIRKLVTDNIKPEIKLVNSDILTFKQNSTYKEFGATAIDNCDGDISAKIEVVSNVDTSKHEVFVVTYKVKDNAGNEAEVSRKIKVYNSEDLNKGYSEIVSGPTFINNILIVNKKYSIPSNYKADNTDALKALATMQLDAKKSGYSIPTRSGYRDYNYQQGLYDSYKRKYGKEFADQRAAHAGHSEHQTGLAFDIGVVSTSFGNTPSGIWLRDNCAKYGFIIRYPEYKEAITGYGYEPWHVRYVGVEIATEIMEKSITLEEYLGIYDIND